MRFPKSTSCIFTAIIVLALLGAAAFFTRGYWTRPTADAVVEEKAAPVEEPKVLKLTPQARKNLNLASKPARPQTYWRKIQVPGAIVDRPGHSDRGVTSPAVGVVTEVHAFPGDIVRFGSSASTCKTRKRNSSVQPESPSSSNPNLNA